MNILNILTLSTPTEWEHGWRTSLVVATRYSNPHIGFNVGFKFPRHAYDCDRAELIDFMEDNGWSIYRCGGYPGAEVFAVSDRIKNKEDANSELIKFVPKLHNFMKML